MGFSIKAQVVSEEQLHSFSWLNCSDPLSSSNSEGGTNVNALILVYSHRLLTVRESALMSHL